MEMKKKKEMRGRFSWKKMLAVYLLSSFSKPRADFVEE